MNEAKAALAAPPSVPAVTAVSDGLATDDAREAFEQRCLDAIAADLGVERMRKTWGGMLSARLWGPPGDGLWFWKPMVRMVATGETELYTCRTSNDRGFEVLPGL